MLGSFRWPLLGLIVIASPVAAQQPLVRIESIDRQKIVATITYEIRTTNFAVSRWMVFLPDPPELPSQGNVKTVHTPAGKIVREKGPLGRKVYFYDQTLVRPEPGSKLLLQMDIEAMLRFRKLVPLDAEMKAPKVVLLSAVEQKAYLATTSRLDHAAKPFQNWLDSKKLRRVKGESALDLAQRVLQVIQSDFTYHFDSDEEKRASAVVQSQRTDCGGMTFAFVAAMRANEVPARALIGRRASPREPGSAPGSLEYDRPHVRAEFFAPELGWVPVDPADAHAARGRPARDFLGLDHGDLLVLHIDPDLQLPFPDKVREAQFLQVNPFYWTFGKGTFDGSYGPTGWKLNVTKLVR